MRKAARTVVLLLFAYLIQSAMLPYLKINGVMLDLVSVTLYTIGFTYGYYAGAMAGLLAALVMEVVGGDLPGYISVACVLAGGFGAYVAVRVSRFTRVGKRGLERAVKQFAPMVAVGIYVIAKEAVYVVYFYLTGVDIGFIHIFRMLLAGVLAAVSSLALIPLLYGVLTRKPKKRGKKAKKAQNNETAKPGEPAALGIPPVEGGSEA